MPLFGIEYDVYQLFAAVLSIVALVGFFVFLQYTKIGTWMRAVRHDRDTAIAMGIPAQRIYILTFGIGFALAAFGGAVAAPIATVDFRGGVDILPFCFMAVIIGGLGNLPVQRRRRSCLPSLRASSRASPTLQWRVLPRLHS